MRVRYDTEHFPQDLRFQATPNQNNYQVRYFITHPYPNELHCSDAFLYYQEVVTRRQDELSSFYALTNYSDVLYPSNYVKEFVEKGNEVLPLYKEHVKALQEKRKKRTAAVPAFHKRKRQ